MTKVRVVQLANPDGTFHSVRGIQVDEDTFEFGSGTTVQELKIKLFPFRTQWGSVKVLSCSLHGYVTGQSAWESVNPDVQLLDKQLYGYIDLEQNGTFRCCSRVHFSICSNTEILLSSNRSLFRFLKMMRSYHRIKMIV
jgi:hypothetical protein